MSFQSYTSDIPQTTGLLYVHKYSAHYFEVETPGFTLFLNRHHGIDHRVFHYGKEITWIHVLMFCDVDEDQL